MLEGLEPTSSTWMAFASWAEKEIESCRTQLEQSLPAEKTAEIRGQIKMLRKALDQGKPVPVRQAGPPMTPYVP